MWGGLGLLPPTDRHLDANPADTPVRTQCPTSQQACGQLAMGRPALSAVPDVVCHALRVKKSLTLYLLPLYYGVPEFSEAGPTHTHSALAMSLLSPGGPLREGL